MAYFLMDDIFEWPPKLFIPKYLAIYFAPDVDNQVHKIISLCYIHLHQVSVSLRLVGNY